MSEYYVKIGFWLRAYDGFAIEAGSDVEAIAKAKAAAGVAIQSKAQPEYVEFGARREGVIVFIDRIEAGCRETVREDIGFDDDRIHDA
jgi:hypothetical protein